MSKFSLLEAAFRVRHWADSSGLSREDKRVLNFRALALASRAVSLANKQIPVGSKGKLGNLRYWAIHHGAFDGVACS